MTISFSCAQFLQSASTFTECPDWLGCEIAFAGRSNAGKSSALNRLTGQKKLARTSKTPGRTQLINFFQVGQLEYRLVDLPGYGFAKVALAVKRKWQKELAIYLEKRQRLKGLVLVIDIRRLLTEMDRMMIHWAEEAGMPIHLLLTKADKLSRSATKQAVLTIPKQYPGMGDNISVQAFSSHSGQGVETLKSVLSQWWLSN